MWNIVFKRQTYYIVSAAFLFISIVYIYLWRNHTYIGLWIDDINGQWIVTNSDPSGNAYHSGIRTGDVIISINNDVVENYPNIQKWNEAEGASSIGFRKAGQTKVQIIGVPRQNDVLNLFTQFPLIMLGYIFGIIGFITWLKRPFLVQARALLRLNLCIGLAIILIPASTCLILFAKEAELILVALVPALLLDFFSVFPVANRSAFTRYTKIFFLLCFITVFVLTVIQSLNICETIFFVRKFVLSIATVGILFVIFNLIRSIRNKDIKIRDQAIILLSSTVLGTLPFVLMKAIPTVFNFNLAVYRDISYLFLAFVPFTWYYIIINRFLPDYRILFSKAVSFCIMTLISSLLLFFIAIYFDLLKSLSLNVYLQIMSLTIIVIVCSLFTFLTVDQLIAKFLKKSTNQSLTEKVSLLMANLELFDEAVPYRQMMNARDMDGVFLVAKSQKAEYFKKTFGNISEDVITQDQLLSYFETNKPVIGGSVGCQETVILPKDVPATLYIPYTFGDLICGIFINCQDSTVLTQSESITTAAIEMVQIYLVSHTINKLSHDIKEIERKLQLELKRNQGFLFMPSSVYKNLERERKNIAEGIHAGPLQLSMDLSRWLKVLAEQPYATEDKMTAKVITHLEELITELNNELRETCNELRPSTLSQLGLLSAVEILCKDIMFKESLLISLNYEGFDRDDRFPEDTEIAAYRFIQEGISNALKHAAVNSLQICLASSESKLILTVEDSGKGFDTKQIDIWSLNGFHLGLVGIKERIESMYGTLQIDSKIGKGTVLIATIPTD